jgi:hypothetical protein
MKWIKSLSIGLALMSIVGACLKQPEYSIVPEISLNDLYFKPGNIQNGISDTLVLKFDFKDGDGDLGIGAQDSSSFDFFTPWYYAYNTTTFQVGYTNDKAASLPDGYKWINYQTKKNVPQFDTLPGINCKNWEQISGLTGVTDTLYITQNEKAYNIAIKIFVKDVNQNYVPYYPGFSWPNCVNNLFWGTFKDLSSDRGKKSPIEGTFKYNIQSAALGLQFSLKTLKIQVYILDRAFHQSNVIEKKDFTLAQIKR